MEPIKNTKKSSMISIKVSPAEIEKIKKASNLLKKNMSEFIMGAALQMANNTLGDIPDFHFLTKKDDSWIFKGRPRLKVFDTVYMYRNDPEETSKEDWCIIYKLTIKQFDEALSCVEYFAKDYQKWEEKMLKEDIEEITE